MSYLPLSEVSPDRAEISLPEYVPIDRIGINLERLDRLALLGGFATGVTLSSFSGDTTAYQHEIVGYDSSGTAYAGAASVEHVRRSEFDYNHSPSRLGRWDNVHHPSPLHVRLNTAEMQQRITRQRDPKAWSDQLNAAIGEALRRATWDNYVRRPQYGELVVVALADVITGTTRSGATRTVSLRIPSYGLY